MKQNIHVAERDALLVSVNRLQQSLQEQCHLRGNNEIRLIPRRKIFTFLHFSKDHLLEKYPMK